jgi:hypothetical protein
MSVAPTARSLLVLLGVPLSISCFNPGSDNPFTSGATPDPTTGTTDDPSATMGDATDQPDSDDATAGSTSNEPTADSTTGGPAVCGNRMVEGDEECDDGPANGDTAACKADCTLPYCGDGNVWEGTEECDDADDDDADECPTTCRNATCGDGYLYPEREACDTDELGNGSCMDFGLAGDLACDEQCTPDTSNCYAGCPDGGAFVNNLCWYLSAGCDATNVTCAAHGLTGVDGYINAVWDMPTMQAIADQSGWIAGGVNACCVEFAYVQGGTIYSHNFGPQFYNWGGCYDIYPTVKACNPP